MINFSCRYFICMNGQPQPQNCVAGLIFNPLGNYCDRRNKFNCTVSLIDMHTMSYATIIFYCMLCRLPLQVNHAPSKVLPWSLHAWLISTAPVWAFSILLTKTLINITCVLTVRVPLWLVLPICSLTWIWVLAAAKRISLKNINFLSFINAKWICTFVSSPIFCYVKWLKYRELLLIDKELNKEVEVKWKSIMKTFNSTACK